MSFDVLNECSSCQQHTAAHMWMAMYGSPDHADVASGPDFLSALVPGPAMFKAEVCFGCGSIKAIPHDKYTKEELEAMEKRSARSKEKARAGGQVGKLFGDLFGKSV